MRPFFFSAQRRLDPARLLSPGFMSRSGRWRKDNTARKEKRAAATKAYREKMEGETGHPSATAKGEEDYSSWSQEKLIERVTLLENELKLKNLRYGLCLWRVSRRLLLI